MKEYFTGIYGQLLLIQNNECLFWNFKSKKFTPTNEIKSTFSRGIQTPEVIRSRFTPISEKEALLYILR